MPELLYTFYGDDFTGSTDVLEQLALGGVSAVLFLHPPTADDLARFPGVQAIGIAGDSRSQTPDWMSANLPAIFARLRELGAPVTHYKVCSTFDSSAERGSIGRAIELGLAAFGTGYVPVVVGAPHLRRFVWQGMLFASDPTGAVHRIDRHPMSRHPVTPMREPNLRKHLAAQTMLPIAEVHQTHAIDTLQRALARERETGAKAIVLDTISADDLTNIGTLLWADASQHPVFAAGSSGLTSALISAWRQTDAIAWNNRLHTESALELNGTPRIDDALSASDGSSAEGASYTSLGRSPRYAPAQEQSAESATYDPGGPIKASARESPLLVISGSCSAATERQLRWALAHGFTGVPIDPDALTNPEHTRDIVGAAAQSLARGEDTVLYTSLGTPGGASRGDDLGIALGSLLKQILQSTRTSRVLLCGGDTSSHAVQQLDLIALTWLANLQTGAPLCRAHAAGALNRLELVLKGGQVGSDDFFAVVRDARVEHRAAS